MDERMRRTIAFVGVFLLSVLSAKAEVTNKVDRLVLPTNLWFQIGEELGYKIYWGIIPVGSATIKTEWTELNGRKLIAIRYRALSNKVISTIYPVDSTIESLIDPETFKSVRFTKNLREGKHRSHEVTEFDYQDLTANWTSLAKGTKKTFPLEAETRDLVAFLYAIRAQPFVPNETSQYRVMADDDIYDLWVKVKDREPVKLPVFGKVDSIRVEPEAAFNGIFVRKGKITVWVSDDNRRFVTRVVGSVPVADIDVVLCEVHGPGDDSWTKATPPRKSVEVSEAAGSSDTGSTPSRKKPSILRRR
jgi:hypothetical protein